MKLIIYSDFYIKSKIPPKIDYNEMMRISINKLKKEIIKKNKKGYYENS